MTAHPENTLKDRKFCTFENLTFVPIQKKLIVAEMLTKEEVTANSIILPLLISILIANFFLPTGCLHWSVPYPMQRQSRSAIAKNEQERCPQLVDEGDPTCGVRVIAQIETIDSSVRLGSSRRGSYPSRVELSHMNNLASFGSIFFVWCWKINKKGFIVSNSKGRKTDLLNILLNTNIFINKHPVYCNIWKGRFKSFQDVK